MANNTTLNQGSGGDTIRSVQKGGTRGPKAQVVVLDGGGSGSESLVSVGQKTMAQSIPVVLPSDQSVTLKDVSAGKYETVAAGQSDQVLGATGGTGDYLAGLLIIPATTSPGAVSIKDGSGSAITVFTGGATSVVDLAPFFVPLGIYSTAGAWKVTTGSNVSAIGVGNFA